IKYPSIRVLYVPNDQSTLVELESYPNTGSSFLPPSHTGSSFLPPSHTGSSFLPPSHTKKRSKKPDSLRDISMIKESAIKSTSRFGMVIAYQLEYQISITDWYSSLCLTLQGNYIFIYPSIRVLYVPNDQSTLVELESYPNTGSSFLPPSHTGSSFLPPSHTGSSFLPPSHTSLIPLR
ncbi:uncharacterized protein LOC113468321, partial [Diaphorina citri]|uniref:Uncharacterized protein LOC113468321 n=1 Tax=Diaphorina citri TaxID=121845 RepID=A0A3Q0J2I8_DIACI